MVGKRIVQLILIRWKRGEEGKNKNLIPIVNPSNQTGLSKDSPR